jgi:Na+-driven multidrug efflux pump
MVFVLFTKYLQNQNILTPCVLLALLSNIFNIVCNYLMIYASGSSLISHIRKHIEPPTL